MKGKSTKNLVSNEIKMISITAIFLSLSLIFKYLGFLMPITGYPLEIELIIFIIGLISIRYWRYRLIFLSLAPFLWVLIVPPAIINIWQVLVEYFIPQFCFILIPIIFEIFKKNNIWLIIFCLISATVLVYLVKCGLHTLAGFYWWTNNDWKLSLIINIRIIGINLAVQLPVSISLIVIILKSSSLSLIFFGQKFKNQKLNILEEEDLFDKSKLD